MIRHNIDVMCEIDPNNLVYSINFSLNTSTISHLLTSTVQQMVKISTFTTILKIEIICIRSCIYIEVRS